MSNGKLIIKADDNEHRMIRVFLRIPYIRIAIIDERDETGESIALDKKQAIQLRDFLNEFIEANNE